MGNCMSSDLLLEMETQLVVQLVVDATTAKQ